MLDIGRSRMMEEFAEMHQRPSFLFASPPTMHRASPPAYPLQDAAILVPVRQASARCRLLRPSRGSTRDLPHTAESADGATFLLSWEVPSGF